MVVVRGMIAGDFVNIALIAIRCVRKSLNVLISLEETLVLDMFCFPDYKLDLLMPKERLRSRYKMKTDKIYKMV